MSDRAKLFTKIRFYVTLLQVKPKSKITTFIMHKTIVLFFALCTCAVFAQTPKFQFGIGAMPLWSDHIILSNGNASDDIVDLFKKNEKGRMGYMANIFAAYHINPKSSFRFGLGYSNTGYNNKKISLIFVNPEPAPPQSAQFSWIHHDITVPLLFKYYINAQKSFYLLGGIMPLIKLQRTTQQKLWYSDGTVSTQKFTDGQVDYWNVNANGTVGIGYQVPLFSKIHWFIEPTFSNNILGVAKSANINRRIFSIGLHTGIAFQ